MASKNDFSAPEWELIQQSPYWVQAALNAAEGRMGLMEKRREAAALKEFMEGYKTSDSLVKAILAEPGEAPAKKDSDTLEEVGTQLREIADIVDRKSDDEDYDEFTDFLLAAGNAVAGAVTEALIKKGKDAVSDEEAEALDLVATALKATDADKHARAAKAAAARRAELARKKKEAEAARAEKEKEAEMKKALAEAEEKVKAAEERERKRKEAAEKQAKARAARQKRLREARKKKEAEARAAAAAAAAAAAEAGEEAAVESAAVESMAPAVSEDGSTTYTVQAGDSLWAISAEMLGAGNRYMEIFNLNTDKLKDPGMIFPGQELKIPAK